MGAEAMVLGSLAPTAAWYWMGRNAPPPSRQESESQDRRSGEPSDPRAASTGAWLTADDVALLVVRGEYLEASVTLPPRFAPQALESARKSVLRWTAERRIFNIHDLYPRYQFDAFGRPRPAVERAIAVLGAGAPLQVGNWFSTPNRLLGGKRPAQLLDDAPDEVIKALQRV